MFPLPAKHFDSLSNDLMKDNKLIKGEMTVRGEKVDLANIKSNLLVISSKKITSYRKSRVCHFWTRSQAKTKHPNL